LLTDLHRVLCSLQSSSNTRISGSGRLRFRYNGIFQNAMVLDGVQLEFASGTLWTWRTNFALGSGNPMWALRNGAEIHVRVSEPRFSRCSLGWFARSSPILILPCLCAQGTVNPDYLASYQPLLLEGQSGADGKLFVYRGAVISDAFHVQVCERCACCA
jgi:hypothetical protein